MRALYFSILVTISEAETQVKKETIKREPPEWTKLARSYFQKAS